MNSENTDITGVLEYALQSADPAVRAAAIRYRKLEHEKLGLDAFFQFYAQERAQLVVSPPVLVQTKPGAKASVKSKAIGNKPDDFVVRVNAVLTSHGSPMKIGLLYNVYFDAYPDQTRTAADTFRQRLFKRRDRISLIEGRGYWPADAPEPQAASTEDALAA